jgi:hypothetical protein
VVVAYRSGVIIAYRSGVVVVATLIIDFGGAMSIKLDFFMWLFLIFSEAFFKTELNVSVAADLLLHFVGRVW